MQSSNIGILITDADANILSVNPGYTRLTGLSAADSIGKKPSILHSGKQDKVFYKQMWASIKATGSWNGELYNKKQDGTTYLESLCISKILDDEGNITNYLGVFQDVTAEQAYTKHLIKKALFDDLTGIYTRSAFDNQAEKLLALARRENKEVAFLFVDLNKFKNINDQYGHKAGDHVLIHTSHCLKNTIRESDLVSRFGGDEFIVALYQTGSQKLIQKNIEEIIGKVIGAINQPLKLSNAIVTPQVSIGVTVFPKSAISLNELIKKADQAMYKAKQLSSEKSNYSFWEE